MIISMLILAAAAGALSTAKTAGWLKIGWVAALSPIWFPIFACFLLAALAIAAVADVMTMIMRLMTKAAAAR